MSRSVFSVIAFFNMHFLAHLSFSDHLLSICPFVNFPPFHLLKNHCANFNQTCHKTSLGEGNSTLFNYSLNKCVYWFKLVSQVSDVVQWPLVWGFTCLRGIFLLSLPTVILLRYSWYNVKHQIVHESFLFLVDLCWKMIW